MSRAAVFPLACLGKRIGPSLEPRDRIPHRDRPMWYYFHRGLNLAAREIGRLDPEHWLLLGMIAIVLGMLWLRGFGSRRNF
ncbi:MAG: hypothetical protein ACUVQK_05920 [Thermogutta sp.]